MHCVTTLPNCNHLKRRQLYPSFRRKSVLLEFSTRLFQTLLCREGQGLLVQVSGMASPTAQQHSQHLAVAVLGSCYSAQPRRLLMLPRREARSDDGCAVALPLLTCTTEMATPSQNTSSLHLKDTQMEIITKAYHRCKCGEYLNPGAPPFPTHL